MPHKNAALYQPEAKTGYTHFYVPPSNHSLDPPPATIDAIHFRNEMLVSVFPRIPHHQHHRS